MRTVVISDLHLSAGRDGDLLRAEGARERLWEAIEDADRVVLLGDVVELRDRPIADAIELAAPFLGELRSVLPDAELLLVAGNHDHRFAEDWLEARALESSEPLGLEHRAAPSGVLERLTAKAGVELELVYPGLWLREDVYATHGHYLDRHLTVPTFERLGLAAVERVLGFPPGGPDPLDPPDGPATSPEEYEQLGSPVYALLYELAQSGTGARRGAASPSARIWALVGGGDTRAARMRGWLLGSVAVPGAVGAANRLGLGPVRSDLSARGITEAGLEAMREVVARLRIGADHVIFGHTHRRGPLGEESGWRTTAGTRLWNTGSWVHLPTVLGRAASESPYWPGTVAVLGDAGPPHLEHVLDDLDRDDLAELRPDGGRGAERVSESQIPPETTLPGEPI
ncbi:MAG: metallophosphoesterase family protein [Solirubrobacterales bacterium]|nr:metallophosphoesterase family protein [Solirubrobacterales bacterium]